MNEKPFTKRSHARHLITLSHSSSLEHHFITKIIYLPFSHAPVSILQIRPGKKQRTPNKCRWMCAKRVMRSSVHAVQSQGNTNMCKDIWVSFQGGGTPKEMILCVVSRRAKTERPIILGLRRKRQWSHRQEPSHGHRRTAC